MSLYLNLVTGRPHQCVQRYRWIPHTVRAWIVKEHRELSSHPILSLSGWLLQVVTLQGNGALQGSAL